MKGLFLFIIICFSTRLFSQTLFTYGNNVVTKSEFLRAYNKNKTVTTDKEKALREYLDLYIKFKLKVKAAQDMHLDTLASLKNELQNFRTQIEENYLNDETQVNALVQEAFDRSHKDIHVEYLYFPFDKNKDTSKAFTAAELTYKQLTKTKSADAPDSSKWTDAGFITVFSLPYDFENIVYSLKPGQVSKPYKTKIGYYIFKNVDERKAVGKIKAAQILIAVPPDANQQDRNNAYKLADSIYHAVQSGADFGELAREYSNDKLTYMTGGVLPEFGVGKYEPAFENKVFALQKDGDITSPIATSFGYHIVKRISKTEVPSDKSDAGYVYSLKQQVQQDTRIASAKEKFTNDILKKLHFKKNAAVKENDLWKLTDSLVSSNKKIILPSLNDKTVLFNLNNKNYTVGEWLAFVKEYKNVSGAYRGETDKELLNKFITINALENYRNKLEDFNPEFKYQVEEFKDGNMLFEVMERNVWNKASNDSIGLKKYYDQYKNKYLWNESADAVLISAANERTAREVADEIKKGKSWRQIAEGNTQIQIDSSRYELAQIPAKPNTKFTAGMITEPLVNDADGTASFVVILKIYPPNQQRTFEEARGLVINDYQNYVEEKWIDQLKKKYPVKVNETVFHSLL